MGNELPGYINGALVLLCEGSNGDDGFGLHEMLDGGWFRFCYPLRMEGHDPQVDWLYVSEYCEVGISEGDES